MQLVGRIALLVAISMLPVADVTVGAPLTPATPGEMPPAATTMPLGPFLGPPLVPPMPLMAPKPAAATAPQAAVPTLSCKNPSAIGTSRVIVVDPKEHGRIGRMNYAESLPLNDHEVVLTFDDGPLPPYTTHVLNTLASQCVKATFFLVGKMAQQFPSLVRRTASEGHTIATHSQTHPHNMQHMTTADSEADIDAGIDSVTAALKDAGTVAPFFRFPGFAHTPALEQHVADRGIMVWSADFPADDWKHVSSKQVVARALSRLEHRGRGVLLLHDIQPATVMALPELLKELKKRNFKIIQVVPSGPDRPKTVTDPQQWIPPEPPKPQVTATTPVRPVKHSGTTTPVRPQQAVIRR